MEGLQYPEISTKGHHHNCGHMHLYIRKYGAKTILLLRIQDCLFKITFSPLAAPTVMIGFFAENFRIKALLLRDSAIVWRTSLKTCIAHISVKNRRICLPINKLNDRLAYTIRSRHTRTAEVKYLICAVFRMETVCLLQTSLRMAELFFYIGFHFFLISWVWFSATQNVIKHTPIEIMRILTKIPLTVSLLMLLSNRVISTHRSLKYTPQSLIPEIAFGTCPVCGIVQLRKVSASSQIQLLH